MRWLLDQGLPRSAAGILHDSKEDAIHIGDIGMSEAPDLEIIQHASSEDRVIVTLDSDFHALLAAAGSSKPSVIRIREEALKGHQIAELVLNISRQFKAELERGCVMSFLAGKIRYRVRPL